MNITCESCSQCVSPAVGSWTAVIPSPISVIADFAFNNCGMNAVIIPTFVVSLGHASFSGSNIVSIVIPTSVTFIGTYTFQNCRSLLGVSLPTSLTSIPEGFLYNATALQNIHIPKTVLSIGLRALSLCSSLKTLEISSSQVSVSSQAFDGDLALSCIVAPPSTYVEVMKACKGCPAVSSCVPSSFHSLSPSLTPTVPPSMGFSWDLIAAMIVCSISGGLTLFLLFWLKSRLNERFTSEDLASMSSPYPTLEEVIASCTVQQGQLLDRPSTYPMATATFVHIRSDEVFVATCIDKTMVSNV